ncbi:MAG: (Fe-S)-binding protein [Nanoarchaeota archaeon]|nr:(Fe-S)-binding protein [Nanoarchaeota archaeon]
MKNKKSSSSTVAHNISSDKPTESDKIEASNLLEEASETFDSCTRCGMCKSLCPIFKVLKEERVSPRGKGVILSEKITDKVLFECTLCKACEQRCPLGIKICDAIRKGREAMALRGKGLKSNEEMIKNIRKYRNPFGKGEINKEKLYCC